jgi:hypothetical protein
VKRALLFLTVSAFVILIFTPVAMAQDYAADEGSSASATATAMAGSEATAKQLPETGYLKKTGGPSLAGPIVLAAAATVVTGVVALRATLRRYSSS